MMKELAGHIMPSYYDGTPLAASDIDHIRELVRTFADKAFEEVLAATKIIHDCAACEVGFRTSTLYPAVEVCLGEFRRLWADKMAAN
jgi:hypothetical protein